jgi:hypothetical protein
VKTIREKVEKQVNSISSISNENLIYDYRSYIPEYDMKNSGGDTILNTASALAKEALAAKGKTGANNDWLN